MCYNRGVKTKLTPELQTRICDYISKGNYIETSCQACGIDKAQYYRWLEKGAKEEKDGGGIYCNFRNAIKKADATGEVEIISYMLDAAKKGPEHWMAAARIAEARWGDRWARVQRGTLNVDVTHNVVSLAELARKHDSAQLATGDSVALNDSPEIEGEFKEIEEVESVKGTS